MVQEGTAAIWRNDSNGQNEATQKTASDELIEFNSGATQPDALSHLSSARITYTEDLSIHPNPNRHLSQIQAGKLGTQIVLIKGYFDTPASSGGITQFFNWMKEDKTNASLPFGRFGIRVNNMSQLDQTPSSTIGYILQNVWIEDIEEFQTRANFECILYRNGTA